MSEEPPRIRIISRPMTPEQQRHRDELLRRQEWRHNFLVPLYAFWTQDVPEPEAQAALQGVMDAVTASGQNREVLVYGSQPWGQGEYGRPEWYIEGAFRRQARRSNLGYGPQVVASEISRLFFQEPWQQNPHWEVFIVNQDLTEHDENINFVYGSTNALFPSSVQSVTRPLAEIRDSVLRRQIIRRLLRHEVGHMFGLPGRDYRVEQKLGLHCTNICTMRQGMNIREWQELTRQEEALGIHFCRDCMQVLDNSRSRFQPMPQTPT